MAKIRELESLEMLCRALAYCFRLDAEAAKGSAIEKTHLESRAKLLAIAERIKACRDKHPSNVRPIKPLGITGRLTVRRRSTAS